MSEKAEKVIDSLASRILDLENYEDDHGCVNKLTRHKINTVYTVSKKMFNYFIDVRDAGSWWVKCGVPPADYPAFYPLRLPRTPHFTRVHRYRPKLQAYIGWAINIYPVSLKVPPAHRPIHRPGNWL